ncbi:FG-GAP repeat domain-containing protein [Hyalangium gracile]|uniref:FG-GAP repeat domain-containing protein n=1 Tax=Hyalangium gracile TaxID=394092 RepID=UPI001CCB601D|nr:VCBS repeat-containing protein [Hyalangium gracile]
MSSLNTMSWVGVAVVSLFAVGCGQPEAVEAGADLATSTQALDRCNDEGAFDVSGVFQAMGRFPAAMACADFNGDRQVDLAVTDPDSGTVSVFLNQGDGTLASQVSFPVEGGSAVVARDIDADGWVDLAVTNGSDGTVSVLRGHGPGGFAAQVSFASLPSAEALAVAE